ncbi:Hypothetical predicted protein [Pelobates cultripes]|uniref:Uncharacterized protein n=1 Tax=Pelobates cultripes TaxID=61616 RepID=A0AAD1RTY8_PELCU|nr:Hypothetical predicted protein [Pelobates cultripes]
MAPTSPGSTISVVESTPDQEGLLTSPTPDLYTLFASLPKKEDFQKLVEEVKGTLQTEIASVCTSMTSLEARISSLEERDSCAVGPNPSAIQQHAAQIADMRLHIEDFDNRSRRHNIRVRGLRETPDQ